MGKRGVLLPMPAQLQQEGICHVPPQVLVKSLVISNCLQEFIFLVQVQQICP